MVVLMLGVLYLAQYEKGLIDAELKTLEHQSQLYAGAIAETAIRPQAVPNFSNNSLVTDDTTIEFDVIDQLSTPITKRMVQRLGEMTAGRIRVYDIKKGLLADSDKLVGAGGMVRKMPLDPLMPQTITDAPKNFLGWLADHIPSVLNLPTYPLDTAVAGFPGIVETMNGKSISRAWSTKTGGVILTAAAPVQNLKQVLGAVYITQDGASIKEALREVTINILSIFALTIAVTIILSLYLAGGIAKPLRRLAKAADTVQQGKVIPEKIPDFSQRRDEIGDLSIAIREMTTDLASRIDSIERFAADVAHEIKNPLTSLRSAVETAAIVSTEKDRKRLFDIIQHDVQRLDRLISDISNASRLDAELAREPMGKIDLKKLLDFIKENADHIISKNSKLGLKNNIGITLTIQSNSKEASVRGIEGRLGQVFSNLVDNALSFSPEDGIVEINAHQDGAYWIVEICDQGPGIPENKIETIFDRFYSERPDGERFGQHSGLGLSISKQIIEAHRGHIYAENIYNDKNQKAGARFIVVLKAE